MADVTITMLHQKFIVRSRYLVYITHSVLSAMQQIGYDLQTWLDYRLSVAKCFFRFISTCATLKEEKRRGFLLAESSYDWRMERILLFAEICLLLLEKLRGLVLINDLFVL